VYEMCAKNISGGNLYVRSKFSCVRSFHDLSARAHAHSLEGTLIISQLNYWVTQLLWHSDQYF